MVPLIKQGLRRPVRVGPGLISMYLATDVSCVISGEGLYFFDPAGSHFVDVEQREARPVGKAHIYVNSDMPNKFADQFAPFKVFGFDPSRPLAGTLIRLPLVPCSRSPSDGAAAAPDQGWTGEGEWGGLEPGEQPPAGLGSVGVPGGEGDGGGIRKMSVEELEAVADACQEWLGSETLLFLSHVESVQVSSWHEGDSDMRLRYKVLICCWCLTRMMPVLQQASARQR